MGLFAYLLVYILTCGRVRVCVCLVLCVGVGVGVGVCMYGREIQGKPRRALSSLDQRVQLGRRITPW